MGHLRHQDQDLHHEDGSHRTTSRSTAGHMIEQHERRVTRHYAEHVAYALCFVVVGSARAYR